MRAQQRTLVSLFRRLPGDMESKHGVELRHNSHSHLGRRCPCRCIYLLNLMICIFLGKFIRLRRLKTTSNVYFCFITL